MKILLDYFFPITSIEPTPQASTSFLKQVCLVVAPAGEAPSGVITLCTTMTQVAAVTANEEAQQLFDAGMSKVYILTADDGDLEDALEGHGEFYTLLISSDFSDEQVGQDVMTPAVAASLVQGDLTFTAKHAGLLGNDISIEMVDDAELGEEVAHAEDGLITIHIADGFSSAQQIKDSVDDSVSASALVTVAIAMGEEASAQDVFAELPLTGGEATVFVDGTGLQVGTWKGVIGVSSDDDEFLADQAVKPNRAAFHSTTGNKAQNMCYAFGKLLSNALHWRNQQYITMPLADDVDTLGDANALFESKESFVISDDEFGERLALFACGGKAITAPYIIRNLEIDMQSAALSYISGNQPAYTMTQAALLEDELQKVVQSYIDDEEIEAGVIQVSLEEDNFVASADINIAEPKALWRIFGEMRQTL